MSIYELAKSIRETNQKNGFDCPSWDNLPNKVMFAVTELDEGMDAITGDGDDPLSEELADTAVRILDVLYAVWGNDWADRTAGILNIHPEGVFQPGEVILWKPLRLLCKAVECWRHENKADTRIALEMALREVFAIGALIGHDLHVDIEWKNAKNATRGRLHGKARSEG